MATRTFSNRSFGFSAACHTHWAYGFGPNCLGPPPHEGVGPARFAVDRLGLGPLAVREQQVGVEGVDAQRGRVAAGERREPDPVERHQRPLSSEALEGQPSGLSQ